MAFPGIHGGLEAMTFGYLNHNITDGFDFHRRAQAAVAGAH
jgi:hypothetical protein